LGGGGRTFFADFRSSPWIAELNRSLKARHFCSISSCSRCVNGDSYRQVYTVQILI